MVYGPGQAYPLTPGVPEGYGPGTMMPAVPGVNPAWLASNADRERSVGVLRAGFTEGRLTQDELHDRVERAYTARTYEQLWALTADLPSGALPVPAGPHSAAVPGGAPPESWKPAAALIITALVIFTLAALITMVITHNSPAPIYGNFAPGVQSVHVMPFIQPGP